MARLSRVVGLAMQWTIAAPAARAQWCWWACRWPTCAQAEPLGTTLSVSGTEPGMAYARQHELTTLMRVPAPRFEQRLSPAFAAELRR